MRNNISWNLSIIYESDEEWNVDFQEVLDLLDEIMSFKINLTSYDNLLKVLNLKEKIEIKLSRLYQYSKMGVDSDGYNYNFQKKLTKIKELMATCEEKSSFIFYELSKRNNVELEEILNNEDFIRHYLFIKEIIRLKKYSLTQEEEKIINKFGNLMDVPHKIFSGLYNLELECENINDKLLINNKTYPIYIKNSNREIRKEAFYNYHRGFLKNQHTFFNSLLFHIKYNTLMAEFRGYESVIDGEFIISDIDKTVYTNFREQIYDNIPNLHEFIKVKSNRLDLSHIHAYDIYVYPEFKNNVFHKKISYEDAQKIILQALEPLGEEYLSYVNEIFNENRVDLLPRKGKISGSYCWEVYPMKSFIITNYREDIDSVFMLIHEIGHAVHNRFAFKNCTYSKANPNEFIAEIAANVNELILFKYIFRKNKCNEVYKWVFAEKIRSVLFRQFMLSEFEEKIYSIANIASSPRDFTREYLKLLEKYYGNSFKIDMELGIEWARIPHFYNTFYVYKYSLGIAYAYNIVCNILSDPLKLNEYLNLLRCGNSVSNVDMIKVMDDVFFDNNKFEIFNEFKDLIKNIGERI